MNTTVAYGFSGRTVVYRGRFSNLSDGCGGRRAYEAMTRSEEELHVGTERRERGRVRLRKYVVTEQVQTTVPVRREEVGLEREPITDANVDDAAAGAEISEAEHEVVLHDEVPVVEKRVVPRERVRLGTDTVADEREISEEVRKERIEVDEDPPACLTPLVRSGSVHPRG